MEFLQHLREPRIKIMNVDIAVFDLGASYLGTYIFSKYILEIDNSALISAIAVLPISYLAHEFFKVNTPLNDAINSRYNNDNPILNIPRAELPRPVFDNMGSVLAKIDFKNLNPEQQLYDQKKEEVSGNENSVLKLV